MYDAMVYKLVDRVPVACSWEEYLGWDNRNDCLSAKDKRWLRRVDWTEIAGLFVSTVFLGIPHYGKSDNDALFETMVATPDGGWGELDDESDDFFGRYATWNEAVAGHDQIVAALRERLGVDA